MVAPIITYTFKQSGYQLSEDVVAEVSGTKAGGGCRAIWEPPP